MRRVASALLGLVAVAAMVVASIGVWAQGTLFDTDEFVTAAGRTYADPQVQAGLADFVTAKAMSLVDVDKIVSDVLPRRLSSLTPMVSGGLESVLHSKVSSLLATEQVADALKVAARQAHAGAMRVLDGGSFVGGVSATDDKVTLNLIPLIAGALNRVQDMGVLRGLDLPDFDRRGDPAEQIERLSDAIGRELPEDFGQLVIYRGSRVESARSIVSIAQRVVVIARRATWLAVAVLVLGATGAVLLATSRLHGVLYLGLAFTVALLLVRQSVGIVIAQAPQLVSNPAARAGVDSALINLSSGLVRTLGLASLGAFVVAVVALGKGGLEPRPLAITSGVAVGALAVLIGGVSVQPLGIALATGLLAGLVVLALTRSRTSEPTP